MPFYSVVANLIVMMKNISKCYQVVYSAGKEDIDSSTSNSYLVTHKCTRTYASQAVSVLQFLVCSSTHFVSICIIRATVSHSLKGKLPLLRSCVVSITCFSSGREPHCNKLLSSFSTSGRAHSLQTLPVRPTVSWSPVLSLICLCNLQHNCSSF